MSKPRRDAIGPPTTVRLFRNGRNQAVRIPRALELPGEVATIRREGGALVLEPVAPSSLTAWLASLGDLDEPWPEIDDPPPEAVSP